MMETISEALESINTLTGHFIGHNLQSLFAVKTTCWSSLWASRRGKKGNWSYLECGWRWWSWMWSIWLCGCFTTCCWSTTWSLGLTEQLSKTENVQRGAVVCRKMSCQRQESEVRGQTGLTAWTTAATKIPLETTETCRTLLILDFFCRNAQQNGFLLIDSFSRLCQK